MPSRDRVSRSCAVALTLVLLGACANQDRAPGPARTLGATIRSMAGVPPGRPDFYEAPVRVNESLRFTAIAAGADHTCALDRNGDTYCWGSNQHQQLGAAVPSDTCGRVPCSAAPLRLEQAPRFTTLAATLWGTCGLDFSGAAHCWGYGLAGRQADGLPASSAVPVRVPGQHAFTALSASGNRLCGLTSEGEAWCWGLGVDDPSAAAQPPPFSGLNRIATSAKLVSISVGGDHSCAIGESLDAICWGSNQFGQLGAGPSALAGGIRDSATPVAAQQGLALHRIAAAPGYTCGVAADRGILCWGLGFSAEASARAADRRSLPHGWQWVQVDGTAGTAWASLAAGTTQACALSADGEIHCFVTTPARYRIERRPVRIESDEKFAALTVGGQHACALGADGFAYCWGLNHMGQAGRRPTGRPVGR